MNLVYIVLLVFAALLVAAVGRAVLQLGLFASSVSATRRNDREEARAPGPPPGTADQNLCRFCGAPLPAEAAVSPRGDQRCQNCGKSTPAPFEA